MQSAYGLPVERAQELAIGGTPTQVADQLAGYVEAGAERLAVISDLTPWAESWEQVAEVRRLLNG